MAVPREDELFNVFCEINDKNNDINSIRKTIIFEHSLASSTLDNRNTCLLLNENLQKYRSTALISNEDISQISESNAVQRKCGLQRTHAESIIESLCCSGTPICDKSESVSEEHFQDFLYLFNENGNQDPITEQKQRTFAKSFAPQTCNVKERFVKHNALSKTFNNDDGNKLESKEDSSKICNFKTAREEMNLQKKQVPNTGQKRKLGTRRGIGSKFVSPMLSNRKVYSTSPIMRILPSFYNCVCFNVNFISNGDSSPKSQEWEEQIDDDRLKNLEPRMIELIKSEIMDKGPLIDWNDIAGLEFAKTAIQEAVVWPMLRPDIFTGLRRPPKGILLFGPPGTGKTLIGKCVASQSKSTFFSISASSLTSKWVGDGEKMVRALFAVARCHQPAVIFIDEIDSLLSQRTDTEHESSRRIKTEFLVQLDGATTDNDEKLLVIGATNRPQELDEAARRRFVKRLYIPLPELKARQQLVEQLMSNEKHELKLEDVKEIAELSEGYSGADMRNLCADASMGPIRSIDMSLIQSIQTTEVRPVDMGDFRLSLARVKSSVSPKDLEQYIVWNKTYGSGTLY